MRRRICLMVLAALALVAAGLLARSRTGVSPPEANCPQAGRSPRISPDYADTCIPRNIAPPNFTIQEPGTAYFVQIRTLAGGSIGIMSRTPGIVIPPVAWRKTLNLLPASGGTLTFDICTRDATGRWQRFEPITNTVAEPIDPFLVYRLIGPVYSLYVDVRIVQRDLESYRVTPVLAGSQFSRGCVNCHTFRTNAPDRMTVGVRSAPYGNSALVVVDGKPTKMDATWGYNSWHPSGQAVAYSLNKVRQFFHDAGEEVRDVVDLDSDLMIYRADTGTAETDPAIADPNRLETYPAWSPDGKYLYYSSALIPWTDRNALPPEGYGSVRYDLRRVPYDVATHRFGRPETVLSAAQTGRSILTPRISPDGRWLLCCMTDYGCFPVYQPSSDLYLLNLKTRAYHRLAINSDRSESWHSWSSNSRWIAFSSKRSDGVFTRTYLSYLDQSGTAHKPLLVPQRDPAYRDYLLKTYSVPELVTGPVAVSARALASTARSAHAAKLPLPETSMTPKTTKPPAPGEPWHGPDRR